MAIGGPAEDIGPRFTVETLAEGCSGGLRWAATRMQGHRPHQVNYFSCGGCECNALGSLAACFSESVRCAGPTVTRACQPAHHVSPQLDHCTLDALALLAMRRRISVSQWPFRGSQTTTCLECLTVMEELRVPRQQRVTTRVYSGEACNAQQACLVVLTRTCSSRAHGYAA